MKQKYVTVKTASIIMCICKDLGNGMSETILEAYLPSDEDLLKWSDKKTDKWIIDNNKRMESICEFLNKTNL